MASSHHQEIARHAKSAAKRLVDLGNATLPWERQGDFESDVNSWYEHELLKKLVEIREIVQGTSLSMKVDGNVNVGAEKIGALLDGEFEKIAVYFNELDDDFTEDLAEIQSELSAEIADILTATCQEFEVPPGDRSFSSGALQA